VVTLKPYQQEACDKLFGLPSGALFMGTGTGKTYTALALFHQLPEKVNKLLIICPPSVMEQWLQSVLDMGTSRIKYCTNFRMFSAKVIDQHLSEMGFSPNSCKIVSQFILHNLNNLRKLVDENTCIIVDESHRIKDYKAQVTKSCLLLGNKTDYKFILTATPTQGVEGGYIDLYTQYRFLGYLQGVTLRQFKDDYCITRQMHIGGVPYPIEKIVGYHHTQKLDEIRENISYSYQLKPSDPPVHHKVAIKRPSKYNRMRQERVYQGITIDTASAMRVALKTMTGGKVHVYDRIEDKVFTFNDNADKLSWLMYFLDDCDSVPVILYQYNVEKQVISDYLKSHAIRFIVLDGANKHKAEQIAKKDYQVVLGQMNACSEGLDGLQEVSHIMVFYSMPESSITYRQCLGRINRIGQTKGCVYYYLVCGDTLDAAIYKMLHDKIEYDPQYINDWLIKEDAESLESAGKLITYY